MSVAILELIEPRLAPIDISSTVLIVARTKLAIAIFYLSIEISKVGVSAVSNRKVPIPNRRRFCSVPVTLNAYG